MAGLTPEEQAQQAFLNLRASAGLSNDPPPNTIQPPENVLELDRPEPQNVINLDAPPPPAPPPPDKTDAEYGVRPISDAGGLYATPASPKLQEFDLANAPPRNPVSYERGPSSSPGVGTPPPGGMQLTMPQPTWRKGQGWLNASRQIQGGLQSPLLEDARMSELAGKGLELGAADQNTAAQQEENAIRTKNAQEAYMAAAITSNKLQDFQQRKQLAEERALSQYNAAIKDAAATKIAPQADAGRAVLGLIAGTIGGLFSGKGIGYGLATFTQDLNAQIDESLRTQQANLANKRERVGDTKNLLDMNIQAGGDIERGMLLTKGQMLQDAALKVDSMLGATKDAQLQAQGEAMKGQIMTQIGEVGKQYAALTGTRETTAQMFDRGGWTGGGGPTGAPIDPARVVHMPDGTVRIAGDAASAQKAKDEIVLITNLKQLDAEALALRKERSDAVDAKDFKAIKVASDRLAEVQDRRVYTLSNAEKQGVVRDPEFVRQNRKLDVTSWDINPLTSGHTNAALEKNSAFYDKQMNNTVQTHAPEVANHGYSYDAKGNLVPVQQYQGKATTPPTYVKPKTFKRF